MAFVICKSQIANAVSLVIYSLSVPRSHRANTKTNIFLVHIVSAYKFWNYFVQYFMIPDSLKTIRLVALDFNEVIVHSGFAIINYALSLGCQYKRTSYLYQVPTI